MKYSIFNNEIVKSNEIVLSETNRGFLYGDGFFESIKFFDSCLFNFKNHFERIIFSSSLLFLEFDLSILALENLILKIINLNKINNGTVKVIVYRDSSGKYLPNINKSSFHIITYNDSNTLFTLNNEPLKIDLYKDNFKAATSLSNIKSLNSLLYILASIYAKKK